MESIICGLFGALGASLGMFVGFYMTKINENNMEHTYNIRLDNNTKVNDNPNEPMDLVEVKLFIQNFLLHVGYGVGNSDVAKMFRELADKWDD